MDGHYLQDSFEFPYYTKKSNTCHGACVVLFNAFIIPSITGRCIRPEPSLPLPTHVHLHLRTKLHNQRSFIPQSPSSKRSNILLTIRFPSHKNPRPHEVTHLDFDTMSSSGYYSWGSGAYSESEDMSEYLPITPQDSSPRSAATSVSYGSSPNSHASSHHSSRSKGSGRIYLTVNGEHVANISGSDHSHSSRREKPRCQSITIHSEENPPSNHRHRHRHHHHHHHHHHHKTHRRMSSHGSGGSSRSAPVVLEPESIYIEENIGDNRPARPLIVDNQRRSKHKHSKSRSHEAGSEADIGVEVRPSARSRTRTSRRIVASPRSLSRRGRAYSWSDQETKRRSSPSWSRSRSRSRSRPRKSSLKRSDSKRSPSRRGRRKSVGFDLKEDIIEDSLSGKIARIRLDNDEISSRSPVPDLDYAPQSYVRPQVHAEILSQDQLFRQQVKCDRREKIANEKRLDRLRRRQEGPAAVVLKTPNPKPKRSSRTRESVVVDAAPPMVTYPYVNQYY